jgi:hypothetical protein
MNTKQIASDIRDAVAGALGQAGWEALTDTQRLLIEECALDAAELQLAAVAASADPAAAARVQREKAHVTAQLASIAAAQATRVADALWTAAANGLLRAAALLA